MTPEGKLKSAVNDYLKKIAGRALVLRLNSGRVKVRGGFMHLCPEGTADYLVCDPQPHWIELKAPGQTTLKARAEKQAEFAAKVQALGHRHAVCKSVEDVAQFLGSR